MTSHITMWPLWHHHNHLTTMTSPWAYRFPIPWTYWHHHGIKFEHNDISARTSSLLHWRIDSKDFSHSLLIYFFSIFVAIYQIAFLLTKWRKGAKWHFSALKKSWLDVITLFFFVQALALPDWKPTRFPVSFWPNQTLKPFSTANTRVPHQPNGTTQIILSSWTTPAWIVGKQMPQTRRHVSRSVVRWMGQYWLSVECY